MFFEASAGLQSVTCLQLLRTVNRLSCRLALCISASCQLDLCWPVSIRPSGCSFYSNSLLGWRLDLMPRGLPLITEHKTNTMLRSLACFLGFWDDPGWCRAIRMDYLPVLSWAGFSYVLYGLYLSSRNGIQSQNVLTSISRCSRKH